MTIFKPMLAVQHKGLLLYDDYVISPKYDGIRSIIRDSFPMSRTMKLIPNKHIQQAIGDYSLEGFDGELIVGEPVGTDVYHRASSGVMSRDGEPDFTFWVFDYIPEDLNTPFNERQQMLEERVRYLDEDFKKHIKIVPHEEFNGLDEMERIEALYLELGFEGAMIRRLSSPYKQGRSTLKQGWLLKLKRFEDREARVIGFECLYKNENEAQIDELGHTKRSSHKENKTPMPLLGSLECKCLEHGIKFSIGSGFTHAQREQLWQEQNNLVGRIVKFKHFAYGQLDSYRFPTFLGFRHVDDM